MCLAVLKPSLKEQVTGHKEDTVFWHQRCVIWLLLMSVERLLLISAGGSSGPR